MIKSIVFLAIFASLSIWAANDKSSSVWGQNGVAPAARHYEAASLSDQDKEFISAAAIAGMFEVQESQIASQKSSTENVKKFADQMVSDHTTVNNDLAKLATSKDITVPTQLNEKYQKKVDALNQLSGADLDKTYVKDQVKAHKDAVKLFQKEIDAGQDGDLKQFASTNLPTLQHHLTMAQDLENGTQMSN